MRLPTAGPGAAAGWAREPRGLCTSQEGALRWGEDENKARSCLPLGNRAPAVVRGLLCPLSSASSHCHLRAAASCARGAEAPRSRAGGLSAGARQKHCGERWQCLKSPDCWTHRRGSPRFLAVWCIFLSFPRPQVLTEAGGPVRHPLSAAVSSQLSPPFVLAACPDVTAVLASPQRERTRLFSPALFPLRTRAELTDVEPALRSAGLRL